MTRGVTDWVQDNMLNPAYFGILQMIQSLNLRVLEIPTDSREGLCLDALREAGFDA